ncbi:hypothetical protein [Cohnella kolymensis]
MGLAVCHRIVEAHKGTMSIRSILHKSMTVEINFPA